MNTRIPSAFLALAAALALPVVSRAAEDLSPEVLADEFVDSPAAPIPNESGVIMRDGKAYLLQRLQGDLALPNGTLVDTNGRVTGFDGTSRMMQSRQVLTLDGQLQQLPAGSDQSLSTPSLTPGSTGATTPQDFFAPASGSFPGRNDTMSKSAPEQQPDTGDFSD